MGARGRGATTRAGGAGGGAAADTGRRSVAERDARAYLDVAFSAIEAYPTSPIGVASGLTSLGFERYLAAMTTDPRFRDARGAMAARSAIARVRSQLGDVIRRSGVAAPTTGPVARISNALGVAERVFGQRASSEALAGVQRVAAGRG